MTEEERQALIALLAGQIGGGVNPLLMSSAYPYNVSPAGVTSSFNPEILLSSGLVSPETVARGQQDIYTQLMADWTRRSTPRVDYEASDQYLIDALGRYATGTDPISDFVRQAADRIASGSVTVDQVLAQGQEESDALPKEVRDNWANVTTTLTNFGKSADTYRTAQAKQAYDTRDLAATVGPAPTMSEARTKFFTDLGVPQFAVLPDPTEQYAVSGETFIADRDKFQKLQQALATAERARTASTKTAKGREAIRLGKEAEIYARKAAMELAGKTADAQVAGMKDNLGALDYARGVNNVLAGTATGAAIGSVVPVIGTGVGAALGGIAGLASAFTGGSKEDDELERKKREARQAIYMKELARRNSEIPTMNPEESYRKYSDVYRAADVAAIDAGLAVKRESDYAQAVADAFNRRLAERGVTPYNQAMNSLLGYAIQTGRK